MGFQPFIFQGDGVFFCFQNPPTFAHRLLLDARWARRGAKARNLREKLSTWCPGFGCKKSWDFLGKECEVWTIFLGGRRSFWIFGQNQHNWPVAPENAWLEDQPASFWASAYLQELFWTNNSLSRSYPCYSILVLQVESSKIGSTEPSNCKYNNNR